MISNLVKYYTIILRQQYIFFKLRYEKPFSGMIMSGFFTMMFGSARTFGIHSIWYLFFAQILGGICQSTGWPGMPMGLLQLCCFYFLC